jgi:pyrroline-5-carboxylate reductase
MVQASVIGCGNMGGALIKGLAATGGHEITCIDVDPDALAAIEAYCAETTTEVGRAPESDVVVLAVKPDLVADVLAELDLSADHTLVYNFGAGREIEYPVAASPDARVGPNNGEPRPVVQLYDRDEDPDELTNVAPDREAVVEDLTGRLREWLVDVDDPLLRGGVRYPYHERALRDLLTS